MYIFRFLSLFICYSLLSNKPILHPQYENTNDNLCVFFCGALWARSESLLAHTGFHGVVCHGSLKSLLLEVHNVPWVAYNLSLEVHDKLLEAHNVSLEGHDMFFSDYNVSLEAHDVSLEVHDVALEVHNVEVHVDFWEVLFLLAGQF